MSISNIIFIFINTLFTDMRIQMSYLQRTFHDAVVIVSAADFKADFLELFDRLIELVLVGLLEDHGHVANFGVSWHGYILLWGIE